MMQGDFKVHMRNELRETTQPYSPLRTGERVLGLALRLLKEYGCDYRDEILSAAEEAFDEFIRPIDFPLVDGQFEVKLEDTCWELVEKLFNEVANNICE